MKVNFEADKLSTFQTPLPHPKFLFHNTKRAAGAYQQKLSNGFVM
jgi:hypothetical protein